MKPLFERDVSGCMEQIVTRIGRVDFERHLGPGAKVNPLPERHPLFSEFKPTRVTKKGQTGKDKSTRGYIWVDTDPVAILFNKSTIRSCHSVDPVGSYSGGNITHLYCPYMASVFAHRESPLQSEPLPVCYEDGEKPIWLILDGEKIPFMKRPHSVVANVFLMSDEKGSPYLFLGRIYDSCNEHPWGDTIRRYFKVRCSRLGIGFAIGHTQAYAAPDRRSVTLRSQHFDGAFASMEVIPYYGDDSLLYRAGGNAEKLQAEVQAYKVVEPLPDVPNDGFEAVTRLYFPAGRYRLWPSMIHMCDNCGVVSEDRMIQISKKTMCRVCAEKTSERCSVCGLWKPKGTLSPPFAHAPACCEACANIAYPACGMCGERHRQKDYTARTRTPTAGLICDLCAETHGYPCSICDVWFIGDEDAKSLVPMCGGGHACVSCVDEGYFALCPDCGGVCDARGVWVAANHEDRAAAILASLPTRHTPTACADPRLRRRGADDLSLSLVG